MNLPVEPAPNPQNAKRQQPPLDTSPLPGLPPEVNPYADIGEEVAAQTGLEFVKGRFKGSNSKVIRSVLMSYKEARQLGPEPTGEDDPIAKTRVRLVEISGTFQERRHARRGTQPSTQLFKKAYIILRASDGLLLAYTLLSE